MTGPLAAEALAGGVWRWQGRHPQWHPRGFGDLVESFALELDRGTLLVDPLVSDDGWEQLDALVRAPVQIAITVPYHVRSAEQAAIRYRTVVHGHPACAKRLSDPALLRPLDNLAAVRAHPIGRPRRHETPLHVPARAAIVFGDAVVGPAGAEGPLRMWTSSHRDARVDGWYAGRFAPTLRPLVELAPELVLVGHGAAVVTGGAAALAHALERPPWYHRP